MPGVHKVFRADWNNCGVVYCKAIGQQLKNDVKTIMIFIKILAILFASGAGLLQIGLEYRWHDKRTKKHKRVRILLISLMIVGFLTASILVIYDDRKSEKQIQTLNGLKIVAEEAAKDAKKMESKAIEDRERIKEELSELQDQIKPVVKLATEKYPTLDVKSALVKLATDVQDLQKQNEALQKQTKEISIRDYFHPLNLSIKNKVIERLNQITDSLGKRKIKISIGCESGNRKRQMVAKELIEILSESGFNASGPSPFTSYSKKGFPAVQIYFNPADEDIVRKLAYALNPFLNVQFSGKVENEHALGKVNIAIYGNPIFSEDGIVTFP